MGPSFNDDNKSDNMVRGDKEDKGKIKKDLFALNVKNKYETNVKIYTGFTTTGNCLLVGFDFTKKYLVSDKF